MLRRRFLHAVMLLAIVQAGASGDQRGDVLDFIAPMAGALSASDSAGFLLKIDKNMPGYSTLVSNINGLVDAAEITCSVEFISMEGDTAKLDWYMQVKSRERVGITEQRRQTITIRLAKKKLLSIAPIDFFRPMDVQAAE